MIFQIKNSVGIWAFGANATRFVPEGYHKELKELSPVERAELAASQLEDYIDGLEFHYPQEIDGNIADQINSALGGVMDIYAIALGFHSYDAFIHGSFVNPNKDIRLLAVKMAKEAVDLCVQTGAHLIVWPGGEGYNYPFQIDYQRNWEYFIDGIAQVVDYASGLGVRVLLEHKNSEPAMKILMRDIGMTLFTINKVRERGVDTSELKINMDWQHLIMNGEPLAEYAALLISEGLLGHHHANSGWGVFDDDNMVGAMNFMQVIGLAVELQKYGYGSNGERIGFDLFPYTENVFEAVKRSVLQWEFIWDVAAKIDRSALDAAVSNRDAVAAYKEVYRALGLTPEYEEMILQRRKNK